MEQESGITVGSIEPFIKGLYNVAPKCKECGDMREYWDDELCVKCRKKKEVKE
jgi:RecJ-like exonuclease